MHSSSGLFPLGVHGEGRAPTLNEVGRARSGSDTTTYTNENEEGGCAKGGIRRNEDEPELGEGFLPSPKQEPPRAVASKRLCEDKAAQTNLGARSHSGNSPEADAEGWIAFANGRTTGGENRPETTGDLYRTAHSMLFEPFGAGASARPRALPLHAFTPPANPPEGKREMRGQGSDATVRSIRGP